MQVTHTSCEQSAKLECGEEMTSKKLYIGNIEVTFADGTSSDIRIHKCGRTIWINDHIVHPSNRNSFEGVIHEIGVITNK